MADTDFRVRLTDEVLDAQEHISFVKVRQAGAVVFFGGITREDVVDGNKAVKHLCYEAHEKMALNTILGICKEAQARFSDAAKQEVIHKIAVTHRLGVVPVLEESIVVALSSSHRKEGWECAVWVLERIKERAEIWKNEVYVDETSVWRSNAADQK